MIRLVTKVGCVLVVGLLFIAKTHGVVVVSTETDIAPDGPAAGDPYTPSFASGGPSAVDLLAGATEVASAGTFTLEASAGLPALTDGLFDTAYGDGASTSNHDAYATAGNGGGSGTSVTYSLGGVFDLTEIVIFGGWNDGGRDQQNADILVSTDGSIFTSIAATLGGDEASATATAGTRPISHRNSITDDSGTLAVDITAIRLDFLAVENGYAGYSEIDVFGSGVAFDPEDTDKDGDIDLDDFILISDNFLSSTAPGTNGDVTFDGFVDAKDFRLWKDAFSALPGSGTVSDAIPEPSTISILALGAFIGAIFRR